MDVVLSWIVAPLGLLLVTAGLSQFVECLADFPVRWAVRPGLGLAVAVVLAQFGTCSDATAELTLPAIVVLAAAGLVLGLGAYGRRPTPAELWVGLGVLALFAAPFVFGEPSWAGYIKLDDSATWMGLTDHVFEYGRGVGDLLPSTHQAMVESYLGGGYPIGAFVPAAIMGLLSGQDVAFTMQPSMAVAVAAMALLIFELCRRVLDSRWLAAWIAVLSSLAALFVGYALWGGVKELVTAALLVLIPVVVAIAAERDWVRSLWLPLGVAVAAVIGAVGPGGAAWLAPMLLVLLLLAFQATGVARGWTLTWTTAGFTLLLVLPVLIGPDGIFNPVQSVLTEETELGNLNGPLSLLQAAGLWPSLDFRVDPHVKGVTVGLSALVLLLAAATVVYCINRWRTAEVTFAAWVGGVALGAGAIILVGSPWVDGKAMATASPALLAAAFVGLAMLRERTPFRLEAAILGALFAGFVAWGAALAYQGVWLAPRDHYEELAEIGEEFAGEGPALSTEVSGYGPRHFLRKLDADGATDLRSREVLLIGGESSQDGQAVDLDQIQSDQLAPYALIVTRRGPTESRPGAGYELAKSTDHYEVWSRRAAPGAFVEHMPLGNGLDPGGEPDCADIRELASDASDDSTLIAARVAAPVTIDLSRAERPKSWDVSSAYYVSPDGSGELTSQVETSAGEHEVWLGGVIFGSAEVLIDGEEVASERGVLNNSGASEPLATVDLDAGVHDVELRYHGAGVQPGSAGDPYNVGPLALEPTGPDDLGLETVSAEDYRELCGQRWDWIEAYG